MSHIHDGFILFEPHSGHEQCLKLHRETISLCMTVAFDDVPQWHITLCATAGSPTVERIG